MINKEMCIVHVIYSSLAGCLDACPGYLARPSCIKKAKKSILYDEFQQKYRHLVYLVVAMEIMFLILTYSACAVKGEASPNAYAD